MSGSENKIRIISLLADEVDRRLQPMLRQMAGFRYHRGPAPASTGPICGAGDFTANNHPSTAAGMDVLLLQLGEFERVRRLVKSNDFLYPGESPSSLSTPAEAAPALIAVLSDGSIHEAVYAARLDFDGIIALPVQADHLEEIIRTALARRKRKTIIARRYGRMRQLCQRINRSRRQLRDKVDIICRDLVRSNQQLTHTLQRMNRAYDLQDELMGEFDMSYMLHKALRRIKQQVPQSSALIYLAAGGQIEAHISGSWYDSKYDITQIEELAEATIIERVIQTRQPVLIADGGKWQQITADQRELLAGLSFLALPVTAEGEFLAVLVLYRPTPPPLSEKEKDDLSAMLLPLAKAILSIQRLQHYLSLKS